LLLPVLLHEKQPGDHHSQERCPAERASQVRERAQLVARAQGPRHPDMHLPGVYRSAGRADAGSDRGQPARSGRERQRADEDLCGNAGQRCPRALTNHSPQQRDRSRQAVQAHTKQQQDIATLRGKVAFFEYFSKITLIIANLFKFQKKKKCLGLMGAMKDSLADCVRQLSKESLSHTVNLDDYPIDETLLTLE
jgi:hypothetical protein